MCSNVHQDLVICALVKVKVNWGNREKTVRG